jgi:hypothetical protein
VKRRDAIVSLALSGLGTLLTSGTATRQTSKEGLSEEQLRMLLRQFAGLELQPGEAPKVLASFKSNRFTAKVDPMVQPQADFDPEVEP